MVNSPCSEWLCLFDSLQTTAPTTPPLPTIALANPPFGKLRHHNLNHFALAHSWRKQGDRFIRSNQLKAAVDGEAIFTELCLQQLQPGEVVVMLVPNNLLNAGKLSYARDWISAEAYIHASIQLPPEAWRVECKLSIVSSLLVLERKPEGTAPDEDYRIFMAMCEACGYDKRGHRSYQTDQQGVKTSEIDNDLPKITDEFAQFCLTENQPLESAFLTPY